MTSAAIRRTTELPTMTGFGNEPCLMLGLEDPLIAYGLRGRRVQVK
jgi:hypothetical protein